MADEDPKGVDPRIHRSAESAHQGTSGILCLTCGSTAVDQRSRSELACAACGTAVPWEGEKFAVLRYAVLTEGAIDDALEALRADAPGRQGRVSRAGEALLNIINWGEARAVVATARPLSGGRLLVSAVVLLRRVEFMVEVILLRVVVRGARREQSGYSGRSKAEPSDYF